MARVMIVEDEPITAADLEQRLAALGHEVAGSFDNAEDALASAPELAPDVVLMDIHLRGRLSGIDAARLLRAGSEVPVVFLTAFGDPATVDRACETQPYGYILKPFTERAIASTLQVALTRARAERTHHDRERWMLAALQQDALIAVDERAAVQFMNGRAEQLLGVEANDVLGKDARAILQFAGDDGDTGHPFDSALEGEQISVSSSPRLLVAPKRTPVLVAFSVAPVFGKGGTRAGAVLVVRTANGRTVNGRAANGRTADEPAAQPGPEAGWNQLQAQLSHELNNPLTFNLGALNLALEELDRLRALNVLVDPSNDAKRSQRDAQLVRIEALLRDAREGATRVASVVRELDHISDPEPEQRPRKPPAFLELVLGLNGTATANREPEPAPPQRGRVLVVDDEPLIGRVLQLTLQPEHQVTVVRSAASALELLERGDVFDVILCDLAMPGMDGRELYERLVEQRPELAARMLFMTGGALTERTARFLERMAGRRIQKPFQTDQLLRLLQKQVAASRQANSLARSRK